jgi:SpoIID/LytB domain protein
MLVAAVLLVTAACTGGDPEASVSPTADTPSAGTETAPLPQPTLPASATITLGTADSVMLEGAYAEIDSSCRRFRQPTFEGRYPGDLLVERGDGTTLRVIVTIPFDEYLEGIAEVPPTWPAAALEAQAIAARSYALARIGFTGPEGAAIETPICATTDCQVYGGIPLEPIPGIRRWHAAVRGTDGRSLVFDGRPADAVYFSTSNGRTYGNDEVFGSAPLPYLRGVVERDDGASPTSRWRVELPHDDLAAFLTARGYWSGGRIARVTRRGGVIEIRGAGSTEHVDETEFRGAVNGAAPCLFPGRYPTDSRFGSALPVTIPSRWYTASPGRRSVVLTGRGWGHGVGMVQWGAYGKARKGWTAGQILAAYYGGLRPRPFPEPGLIRVLVADGLTALTATPDGAGASFGDEPLDGRVVTIEPGGNGVRVLTRPSR